MIPPAQTNLANARIYFREHLTGGDYYSQGKQTRGIWFGKAAAELGLKGVVEEDAFLAMCEGVNPNTGETLTARKNTTRLETHNGETKEVANRRAYYDFTLSPPKSVSVAALVGNDNRIVEAHKQAINVAIGELETFAAVRVRSATDPLNGKDRLTGNIAAAVFTTKPDAPSPRVSLPTPTSTRVQRNAGCAARRIQRNEHSSAGAAEF